MQEHFKDQSHMLQPAAADSSHVSTAAQGREISRDIEAAFAGATVVTPLGVIMHRP